MLTARHTSKQLFQNKVIWRKMSMKLNIGMFGGGTVGGGVYEILERKKGYLQSIGVDASITKICVRDVSKPRDFAVGAHTTFTTNFDDILEDPSINCIIELIGGTAAAKDLVYKAIRSGKHVVTANKALVASYMAELEGLLAQHPNVSFSYEASVCGGIPIIHALQSEYSGDDITEVMGIMNGTTNFMLCKMEGEGMDYGDVLKEAQALGFAEADPTADVEGLDVQAKIAILARLSFGVSVPVGPATIPCAGISAITATDFEYAKLLNSTIKLLGTARAGANGANKAVSVYVSPVMVPLDHPLASPRGPGNMVFVRSENLSATSYVGPGAGRYPTANSVVNDVIRLAKGESVSSGDTAKSMAFPKPLEVLKSTESIAISGGSGGKLGDREGVMLDPDYLAKFYIRLNIRDQLGVIKTVGEVAEKHSVSIYAVLQNQITDPDDVYFVITTELCKHSQVSAMCDELARASFSKAKPTFMSML